MSLLYRLAYALGFTPWEKATDTHGHLIAPLLYREEAGCEPPYGPALDLGCGAGYWAVELARRGWDVTGIDSVAKALRRARARTRAAGVEVRFVRGDVTRLEDAGVGSGFRFVYDLGCFHGLGDEERAAMGRGVSALAAPDATLLELAWMPARRGPLPRGASAEDLEAAFVGWKVVDEDPLDAAALPGPLREADPRCYRLRRVE